MWHLNWLILLNPFRTFQKFHSFFFSTVRFKFKPWSYKIDYVSVSQQVRKKSKNSSHFICKYFNFSALREEHQFVMWIASLWDAYLVMGWWQADLFQAKFERNKDFNFIKLLQIIFRSNDVDLSMFWVLWTKQEQRKWIIIFLTLLSPCCFHCFIDFPSYFHGACGTYEFLFTA